MIDLPFKLFPPALLGGLAIHAGITMLWLQPVVETRMAEKYLIPACEAALARDQANAPAPRNQAREDAQMAAALLDMILKETGLDQVPGVGGTINAAREVIDEFTPKPPRVSTIDRNSVCGCAADKAFADTGYSMTLHVASARTHTPLKISALPQATIAIATSGACGALPWSKG